ncbi:THC0290_0291 family protein [Flavobacterium aquidurense]|uniref:THC0290_0291 family protein n=1 Tax=Flavobacterium aquidurense TaxID=362413 RepID=UPI002865C7C2|nr:glutamate dehydrogenase [Flavobacterium aquidurense]MDR7372685.1 hypothetical protein [Flavobacterium aquidurense]
MIKPIILSIFALIGISTKATAQFRFAQEVGIILGPIAFQSDYGERNDSETNVKNTGFGVGLVHFMNFSNLNNHETFFTEHFKVRSEVSLSQTNLEHFGEWVQGNPNKLGTKQLKAMTGKTTVAGLGAQLEFSPIPIHRFENNTGSFSPYMSLGFLVSYYSAKVGSSLGPLGNPLTTYPKYLVPSDGRQYGFSNETGVVLSATAGLGVHYKLTTMSDLMLEGRFQSFSSDWVDGLNPNKKIFKENKAKDWQVWFNVGYIMYLEY